MKLLRVPSALTFGQFAAKFGVNRTPSVRWTPSPRRNQTAEVNLTREQAEQSEALKKLLHEVMLRRFVSHVFIAEQSWASLPRYSPTRTRTMSTKFFGHALFELPRPHKLPPIMVKLSKEETLIYRYVLLYFRKIREKEKSRTGGG